MDAKIDWLSFTLPVQTDNLTEENFHVAIEVAIKTAFGENLADNVFNSEWRENPSGRAPYSRSWTVVDRGITVFTSQKLSNFLCEFSGKGCDYLRAHACEGPVLESCRDRISRLDVAADILTDTKPIAFVEAKANRKERYREVKQSDAGETVYVGSRLSERYCRVYRYAHPHPRSRVLRIEEVFRRKHARAIASEILDNGVFSVARTLGKMRGWTHNCWGDAASDSSRISLPRPEREGKNTVRWLITQAAPAFKRLIADGTIEDPEQFLLSYFMPTNIDTYA